MWYRSTEAHPLLSSIEGRRKLDSKAERRREETNLPGSERGSGRCSRADVDKR